MPPMTKCTSKAAKKNDTENTLINDQPPERCRLPACIRGHIKGKVHMIFHGGWVTATNALQYRNAIVLIQSWVEITYCQLLLWFKKQTFNNSNIFIALLNLFLKLEPNFWCFKKSHFWTVCLFVTACLRYAKCTWIGFFMLTLSFHLMKDFGSVSVEGPHPPSSRWLLVVEGSETNSHCFAVFPAPL